MALCGTVSYSTIWSTPEAFCSFASWQALASCLANVPASNGLFLAGFLDNCMRLYDSREGKAVGKHSIRAGQCSTPLVLSWHAALWCTVLHKQ